MSASSRKYIYVLTLIYIFKHFNQKVADVYLICNLLGILRRQKLSSEDQKWPLKKFARQQWKEILS